MCYYLLIWNGRKEVRVGQGQSSEVQRPLREELTERGL
jgi:hypothetical protein